MDYELIDVRCNVLKSCLYKIMMVNKSSSIKNVKNNYRIKAICFFIHLSRDRKFFVVRLIMMCNCPNILLHCLDKA